MPWAAGAGNGDCFAKLANITGTSTSDKTVVSKVPPATTIAKGGQKPPPAISRGKNPIIVVIVVEQMCREQFITDCATAAGEPADASALVRHSAIMTIAALIASPIIAITPNIDVKPNG